MRTLALDTQATANGADQPERCILVGLDLKTLRAPSANRANQPSAEQSLAELAALASGAGADVVGQALQVRERADPATLLGSGKIGEIRAWAEAEECDFLLFDHDLTPSQHRNLERELKASVLDRTQLILDIFARHARSREGRLQVELAQLDYILPRLAGRGTAMSRLGGGIGTRGPGETKLEHDRRKIRRRITKLRADLDKVRVTRRLQRSKRSSVPIPTVALCGYTNAGKSTLFNALTSANVVADQRMFATLDPTLRRLALPSGYPALLSDTVGFIRKLPPTLIQAFRATLEEVTEASLIIHVADATSEEMRLHMEEVDGVLTELGASKTPQILALNKCDLLEPQQAAVQVQREQAAGSAEAVVDISARTGQGLDRLTSAVDSILSKGAFVRRRLLVPYDKGRTLSQVYEHGRILERRDCETGIELVAELERTLAERLDGYVCERAN